MNAELVGLGLEEFESSHLQGVKILLGDQIIRSVYVDVKLRQLGHLM